MDLGTDRRRVGEAFADSKPVDRGDELPYTSRLSGGIQEPAEDRSERSVRADEASGHRQPGEASKKTAALWIGEVVRGRHIGSQV